MKQLTEITSAISNFFLRDDIRVAIACSIIASVIFWFIFNFLPGMVRRKKIRPKIEFDIYEFYYELFHFIQYALLYQKHSPCFLQHELFAGKLTKENFKLLLQNKCLNESYLYDENASRYITIGNELEESSLVLCKKAEQIYAFMSFVTTEEILLIKKIIVKLRVYRYTGAASSEIQGTIYRPVNPNLSYMSNNFFEIYQMFIKLQEIVLSYKHIDISMNDAIAWDFKWQGTRNSYYRGEYKKCLGRFFVAGIMGNFPEHLWGIKFLCLVRVGKRAKALKFLNKWLLIEKLDLLSIIRNNFDDIYLQNDVKEIIVKACSEQKFEKMVVCIENEAKMKEAILEQANEIKKIYESKKA